ncbi:DUF3073 family protein [Actinokineospora enzanensis]|uniref:DUF3073 family protein n=1 Tax=Actinokineospora enzanensis TaxID=155975 RepID=UPI00037373A0|nr:DUF3073 family protein [Actinokineospora enzanensis]
MGRGRAKAIQAKIARELKYGSQHTDFDALQQELSGGTAADGRDGDGGRDYADDDPQSRY